MQQKVIAIRRETTDQEGNIIDPGGVDDMMLLHWGVYPVSLRDSDGTWRFHQQTVAICTDTFGKVHIVDPEAITVVKEQ